MKKLFRLQLTLLLVTIILFTAFAFASSETRFPGQPGEGTSQISGWTVSNIQYHVSDDPAQLSRVELDLDKPAGTLKISLVSSTPMFFDCENTTGNHWVCNVNALVSLSSMDQLRVTATGAE